MSKRADELWEKLSIEFNGGLHAVTRGNFDAALHEYGAEVRRRDAEVCGAISDRSDKHDYSDYANPKEARRIHTGIHCTAGICAAAIDREELP